LSEESIAKQTKVDFDFEGRISREAHVIQYLQEVKDVLQYEKQWPILDNTMKQWIYRIRIYYNKGELSEESFVRLREVDFDFAPQIRSYTEEQK
jgi:hypothetical protein